jgi:RHS repeat-associated protein
VKYQYEFDDAGNRTKMKNFDGSTKTTTNYHYNDANQMYHRSPGLDWNYTYDAMGRRIMRKDVDNNTYTMYYYDGLTVIAEKKKVGAGSWDWNRIFTVSPGVIGNILRISNKSGEIWGDEYYHYDALGNLAFKTLGDSTPGYLFDQEAYGNVKVGSQSGYHLTTKEYDNIPELYYFHYRWYDSYIGIFLQPDIQRTMYSRYLYVGNKPLTYIDPTGQE